MEYLICYLLIINAAGLLLMRIDKQNARKKRLRIPESILFLTALFGGSLGCTAGMFLFRHKTRHWYFRLGFPAILIAQTILACAVIG